MEVHKKYYYKFFTKENSLLALLMILALGQGIVTLTSDNVPWLLQFASWFTIVLCSFFMIISLIFAIQIVRKVGFLQYREGKFYLRRILGKIESSTVTDTFKCIERSGKIRYIQFFDANGNLGLVIRNTYKINLNEVKKVLNTVK